MVVIVILIVTFILIKVLLQIGEDDTKRKKNNTSKSNSNPTNTVGMDVPIPGVANPHKVLNFIQYKSQDIVRQVYSQLRSRYTIPNDIEQVFLAKINDGYIIPSKVNWEVSMKDYQFEEHQLDKYKEEYEFDLAGVHVKSYRKKLEECLIYETVVLKPEPSNPYDKNAIKVLSPGIIGHVPTAHLESVHEIIKKEHKAFISEIRAWDDYIDVDIIIHYND